MAVIRLSGFGGENRALHPFLLPDTVGVQSTNQKPGRGDLRPWKAPLNVATVPAGRKTIYRMGRDVASDTNYWLSWPTVVHAVRGPNAEDSDERTYFSGSGTPKWTDRAKALSSTSNSMPTSSRELGVPAPDTACILQKEYVAPDTEIGLHTYKVTPAEVSRLAVGDVIKFTFSDAPEVVITLAGIGGVVTLASLAAQVGALAGISASVVTASAAVPAVSAIGDVPFVPGVEEVLSGVRIVSGAIGFSFSIAKKTGTFKDYDPDVVGYGTSFWVNAPSGTPEVLGSVPFALFSSGGFFDGVFTNIFNSMIPNQPGAGGSVATPATATYSWQNINATLTPVGFRLAVTVNGAPPVALTLYAGGGTYPPAVTLKVLVDLFSTVDGLKAEKVLSSNGVDYDLKLSTYATGTNARFDVKQIIPAETAIYESVSTSVAIKAVSVLTETRYYTYTYVSDVGEESAPNPTPTVIVCNTDANITISSLAAAPAGNYGINRIRIYRTQSGTAGDANFFFVREIASTLTTTTDDGRVLSEVMPSTTWLMPEPTMTNLTGLWNGMMAGIYGRSVRFCVEFKPYAWPMACEVLPTAVTPVALCTYGQTLVVLTNGSPLIITGGSPDAMDEQPVEFNQACVSPASAVDMGFGVAWASPDGLAFIGQGGARMLTEGVMTRDDWQAINPSSIVGCMYERRYLGFYTVGGVRKGFMLDPANPNGLYFMDFGVDALYLDDLQDALYVLDGVNVQKWDYGAANKTATFKSKLHKLPKPMVGFACAEVVADSYPVTFRLYADGALKHTESVLNSNPFKLPSGYYAQTVQLEVSTTGAAIQGAVIAHSMQEIAQT